MPAKPTVNALILDKIDHLETNMTRALTDMEARLTAKSDAIEQRVIVQNSRIGKCESLIAVHQAAADATATTEARFSGKHLAGGIAAAAFGSPVVVWVARTVFEAVQAGAAK